jgi:hypothetical protein
MEESILAATPVLGTFFLWEAWRKGYRNNSSNSGMETKAGSRLLSVTTTRSL